MNNSAAIAVPTPIHPAQSHEALASSPDAEELLQETLDLSSGLGILGVTYLGVVPGFLPSVALALVAVAIVLAPLLVVGILFGALLLIGRLISRAVVRTTRKPTGRHRDPRSGGARRLRMRS
jgi:hypothetical protein